MVAQNRKARHDYHLHDTVEAGLVLTGTEVKSLRAGRASLSEAFATVDDGEVWLRNAHIPEYSHSTENHQPRRTRKLLLHRRQIDKLAREVAAAGRTIVPLAIYFLDGYAKVELALATGKRDWTNEPPSPNERPIGKPSGQCLSTSATDAVPKQQT